MAEGALTSVLTGSTGRGHCCSSLTHETRSVAYSRRVTAGPSAVVNTQFYLVYIDLLCVCVCVARPVQGMPDRDR